MRQIIFRGKSFCDDKWVYGDLIHKRQDKGAVMIQDSIGMGTDVDSETVGQFTGVLDKNSKEIYEGDIVTDGNTVFTVFWSDGGFCIESNSQSFGYGYQCNSNPSEPLANQQIASWFEGNVVCLGNIHDNPEILKHSND